MEHQENRVESWRDSYVDHFLGLPLWVRIALVAVLGALVGMALDEALHVFGYNWLAEREVENVVEGLVVAASVYWLSHLHHKRMMRRVKEINFLNHHVRNAMQAIELAVSGIQDSKRRMEVVDLSVRRVIETLSKVSRESDEAKLEENHKSGAA
jgi:hypothetical protein